MLKIYPKGIRREPIPFKSFKFSGGEMQVEVGLLNGNSSIVVETHLTSSDDILELMLVVDAIRRRDPDVKLSLRSPYLPYARQDRVMQEGESLGLRVMCSIINSLNFERVEVWDAHSDVSLALLDRIHHYDAGIFVRMSPIWHTHPILVAPDAGAIKKVSAIAKGYGKQMVRADKVRSVVDGSITGTVVYSDHIGDKDFLIVDDICDGGRTFIELAKVLRPLTSGKVYLYVTHGIFSKGLDVFDGLIDKIYCAKPFPNVDLDHPLLYILPIDKENK